MSQSDSILFRTILVERPRWSPWPGVIVVHGCWLVLSAWPVSTAPVVGNRFRPKIYDRFYDRFWIWAQSASDVTYVPDNNHVFRWNGHLPIAINV